MDWVYLDNNATTRPADAVQAAMAEVGRECWGNASSVHRFGQMARQRVELARASVAGLIGCKDREVVFTSGGTESNNLALKGVLGSEPASRGERLLVTTRIEHSAIREPAEDLAKSGVRVVYVPVGLSGVVEPRSLLETLKAEAREGEAVLVSVQWANNETGVVQPMGELVEAARAAAGVKPRCRLWFHSDATQAVGKISVSAAGSGVDLMTMSAHKFHGPKGVGALYVRTGGARLRAQNLGGPQERDRRGGTENTPAIVGMGVAAELAKAFLAEPGKAEGLAGLRDRLEGGILERLPGAVVNCASAPRRLWNTTNVAFPKLEAEAVLLGLSERGVCASAGAACSSGSLEPSPVLLAMGIPEAVAHGSIRFSISRETTAGEIDRAVGVVAQVVGGLSRTMPTGV